MRISKSLLGNKMFQTMFDGFERELCMYLGGRDLANCSCASRTFDSCHDLLLEQRCLAVRSNIKRRYGRVLPDGRCVCCGRPRFTYISLVADEGTGIGFLPYCTGCLGVFFGPLCRQVWGPRYNLL